VEPNCKMGCFNSKVSEDDGAAAALTAKTQEKNIQPTAGQSHKNSLRLVSDGTLSVKTLTFKHVMADPLGREYFMKFLVVEHAEENLTFFQV
jgi:hypothetical protein